jgi:hypothetical protein
MQHLYHEQTNTISSTSTSSSNHSQSKSNDTGTTISTNANLLQLSSPQSYVTRSNDPPSTLCFRNPHAGLTAGGDPVDYHVYETIPSENTSYSICTFKPNIQSNTHTIRPYHPLDSSKHSFDILSSNPIATTTVLMPVCCHHYATQCSTGTLRQHVLPPTPSQIYVRSETIV